MQRCIGIMILENESEDDNIMHIIMHCENDLCEDILLNDKALHVRNENYFEITVPHYSISDFHAHFRMKRTTMEVNILLQI